MLNTEPQGMQGCGLRFPLFTPNSLASLFSYADSGSEAGNPPRFSYTSSAEHSAGASLVLFMKLLLAPHSLDHPQWALNDRGFYP